MKTIFNTTPIYNDKEQRTGHRDHQCEMCGEVFQAVSDRWEESPDGGDKIGHAICHCDGNGWTMEAVS